MIMNKITNNKEKLQKAKKIQKEIQKISQISLKMMLKIFLTLPPQK